MPFELVDGGSGRDKFAQILRRHVAGEVRFDAGSRALYATDASNYRQVPVGVVLPKSVDDVIATVALCRESAIPVLPRGAGTSLCGQTCNAAVVLDMSKYLNRILELDPDARTARVEPGLVLDDLRHAAERHNLTFAPDPATHTHNTLGGMIGNNSCGVHSVMGGRTADNVVSLDVLTYDGLRLEAGATSPAELEAAQTGAGRGPRIYADLARLRDRYAPAIRERFPRIPRRVSGYGLDELLPENGFHVGRALVGTEGTCVTVLGATVRLAPSPPGRALLVLGYDDVFGAADHVTEVLEHGPIGLEGIDDQLVSDMRAVGLHASDVELLPGGAGWLLAEFGGADDDEAADRAEACRKAISRRRDAPKMKLYRDRKRQQEIWKVRESGLGATAHVPNRPITWEGWEDAAVPPERLGKYLREFRDLLKKFRYHGDLYGHFGQGCVHTRIDFDLVSAAGIRKYRSFIDAAADLVVRYGGSFSGEHGDGQSKAALLPKLYGPELIGAFREFKSIWDPDGRMNPGKVVEPYPPESNLRLGTDYRPGQVETHFHYPDDSGDFNRALLRCVGIGECRRKSGGTMCPSYRATLEEKHSTRGRARLLFEMFNGDVIEGAWRSDAVRDALELCLSCKGCKRDCPVNVDMASYKAEFASHYYAGRLRPRGAYAFGFIDRWARLASLAPRAANWLAHSPATEAVFCRAAGIASTRAMPPFARETFRSWFARRPTSRGGRPVLLWPDTFNDHFHPATARAAVEVLEAAGCRVMLPPAGLCCGRPLYEFGFLDIARRRLERILHALSPQIAAGVPLVVLEPACASVFRDELTNLLHGDVRARRLAGQTRFFDEYAAELGDRIPLETIGGSAIIHAHCHHKAIVGSFPAEPLLKRLGLDYRLLDDGCCGMAGAFGFLESTADVGRRIGELAVLPAVRAAGDATLVVADGFSCRGQIEANTARTALHPAELLRKGLSARPGTLQENGGVA